MAFTSQARGMGRMFDTGFFKMKGVLPCGVLAAIQGQLLAQFINNKFIITPDVQRAFLVTSIAESLLMAQPDVAQIVVVSVASSASTDAWPSSGTASDQKTFIADQMGRAGNNFTSRRQLEACLAELVVGVDSDVDVPPTSAAADWCRKDGYGLLCLVLSLLLSKGIEVIKKDMDVEQPLIVEHGYCSQELTNLVMTGHATSNVHDGIQESGGINLKGFLRSPMPIGFLSFLETKEYLTVGNNAKHPTAPVWLIYHESHYTCMFMKKDTRAATNELFATEGLTSFDLFYYDQQGGQDEEIKLTITLDRMPLPAQRKDALIPYLNVMIRTVSEWGNARVNWNGTDPLL
eukprot:GILI01010926.1.p1 GENE.GILI01010926.1~~GILI01010926.1.p1  ORF type:complete len:347 (+),score=64.72 GILI01010926.1:400-1440(+)